MYLRLFLFVHLLQVLYSINLNAQTVWIEAECTTADNWLMQSDTFASADQSVFAQEPAYLSQPFPDSATWLKYDINLPKAGKFNFFGRVRALDPASNSVWFRVNQGDWIRWDDISLSPPLPVGPPDTLLPVIPGVQGYGIYTPAGRNGQVYKVTNLNDSGPGSLRECAEASGSRVCVFEVSGFIDLQSPINITDPYLTIAGQTAPSPGIMLGKGHGIQIHTHDVLIQHIGVRPGDGPGTVFDNRDAVQLSSNNAANPVTNVVLDHVTMAWGMDENLDMWGYIGEVTVRNCIIAQAMRDPFEQNGSTSYGNLIGTFDESSKISIYENYYVANRDRQPLSRAKNLIFSNNLLYDRILRYVYLSNRPHNGSGGFPTNNTVIGNYFREGPNLSFPVPSTRPIVFDQNGQEMATQIYLADNRWSAQNYTDDWDYIKDAQPSMEAASPPAWIANWTYKTDTSLIIQQVLDRAGARPIARNILDQKLIDGYAQGSGLVVECVTGCNNSVGGWPQLASQDRQLDLPPNPNGDDDLDGYTNLEEWLHSFSRGVESREGAFVWEPLRDADNGDSPVLISLDSGLNSIEFSVREPGFSLDKLCVSTIPEIPSGKGLEGFNCDTLLVDSSCVIPEIWDKIDIGSVAFPGNTCFSAFEDSVEISASGADIWYTEDAFHYAYQSYPSNENWQIEAQVLSLDSTHHWAKAGVMIRTDLSPTAANAMMYISAAQRWSFQRRLQAADSTFSNVSEPGEAAFPYWVRLSKNGNLVKGYVSPDGISWNLVEQAILPFANEFYVGLAVTSHDNSQLTQALFKQVDVSSSDGAFPVELIRFSAISDEAEKQVRLNWSTAMEQNNDYFQVERSRDGQSFELVDTVASLGDGQQIRDYQIWDPNPLQGISFYRLVQMDRNGHAEVFSPVSVRVRSQVEQSLQAKLYPNPIIDSEKLHLEVWMALSESLDLQLVNSLGQVVWNFSQTDAKAGWNHFQFDLPKMEAGLYYMRIYPSSVNGDQYLTKSLMVR